MNAEQRAVNSGNAGRFVVATDPYLSCEECFDLMDRFVETMLADRGPSIGGAAGSIDVIRFASMQAHLAGCPACAEETATLVELAAADSGVDPARALRSLHRG